MNGSRRSTPGVKAGRRRSSPPGTTGASAWPRRGPAPRPAGRGRTTAARASGRRPPVVGAAAAARAWLPPPPELGAPRRRRARCANSSASSWPVKAGATSGASLKAAPNMSLLPTGSPGNLPPPALRMACISASKALACSAQLLRAADPSWSPKVSASRSSQSFSPPAWRWGTDMPRSQGPLSFSVEARRRLPAPFQGFAVLGRRALLLPSRRAGPAPTAGRSVRPSGVY